MDDLSFELSPSHLWLLVFLKFLKCVFSDGSTYNSWNATAGVTAAGCHELRMILSDSSLTHISESIDIILFDAKISV